MSTQAQPEVVREGGCPILHGYDPLAESIVRDPSVWMEVARAQAPVFYEPQYGDWVVTRYDDVIRVLSDTDTFSSKNSVPLPDPPEEVADQLPDRRFAFRRNVGSMDPPEHARFRGLIQPAFARKQANLKLDEIRSIINETLERIIGNGHADFATDFCQRIPVRVIAGFLGIPTEDTARVYQWATELLQLFGNPTMDHDELVRLSSRQIEFEKYVESLIAGRRENPLGENDFVTNLLNARSDVGEPRLSDREITSTVIGAIFAGSETSASAMALIIEALLEERHLWDEVVSDPEIVPRVVEEGLRVCNPTRANVRTTTRDVELGGVTIPKDSLVFVHFWSADRDESVFEDAARFDPHRPNANQHVTFGKGPHFCPGASLARAEVTTALQVLAERVPSLRLAAEHSLRLDRNRAIPFVLGGLDVEWDER